MKGNQDIIDALNDLLVYELTAMDQYFVHSRMYEDMGLTKLYERIDHEFDDEKAHAAVLIERILFLEGKPDLTQRDALNIGDTVPAMLQSDLNIEYGVQKALKKAMALCEKEQDFVTRDQLLVLLDDTETDHAYWLEKQLKLIKLTGLENYLQSQM
ncbi:bacterioferritin [Marinicella sp. S1101]|uniref:bacterioferritin n=1 Tax=Marinicella marina TaxID=2996016 RepID=UPI002260B545|nr:bacterioferritin [Marinicella marina]MCX7553191.1 bacterioferritin [Marinicella marina]MDJ1138923.1 bacterioferritin [Marinicella marina]